LKLDPEDFPNDIFICGGAQIYEQALPRCSDLYLTLVKREVEGDAFFPPFEDKFEAGGRIPRRAGVQDSALPAQVAVEIKM
jgi:dihydrofolate reductase